MFIKEADLSGWVCYEPILLFLLMYLNHRSVQVC